MKLFSPPLTLYVGTSELTVNPTSAAAPVSAAFAPDTDMAPALYALLDGLQARGGRVRVILSDAHCRYLTAARPQGIRSKTELAASLQARFDAIHADDSRAWTLASYGAPTGSVDLAVGANTALIERLQAGARANALSIESIKPHWIGWFGLWRKPLSKGPHWLVCADGAWASIGYVLDGQCLFARAFRLNDGGSEQTPLAHVLARHQALVPDAATNAQVWFGGQGLDTQSCLAGMAGRLQLRPMAALWHTAGMKGPTA